MLSPSSGGRGTVHITPTGQLPFGPWESQSGDQGVLSPSPNSHPAPSATCNERDRARHKVKNILRRETDWSGESATKGTCEVETGSGYYLIGDKECPFWLGRDQPCLSSCYCYRPPPTLILLGGAWAGKAVDRKRLGKGAFGSQRWVGSGS